MKNRQLLSITLSIILVLSFSMQSVLALTPELILSDRSVSVNGVERGSKLVVASYADDRLIGIGNMTMLSDSNVTFDSLGIDVDEADRIKVILIDRYNNLKPLCASKEAFPNNTAQIKKGTYEVPTINGNVATACSYALNEYVKASALTYQLQSMTELPDDDDPSMTKLEAIIDNPIKTGEFITNVNKALAAWNKAQSTSAVLNKIAIKETEKLVSAPLNVKASGRVNDIGINENLTGYTNDEIEWAKEIAARFDAVKGNKKLDGLGKDLGVDARVAYAILTHSQNILNNHYMDKAESCTNTIRVLKAVNLGAKVTVFVMSGYGTLAAATTLTGIGVAQATGLVVSGVDMGITFATDGASIIVGDEDRAIQMADKTLKPYKDVMFIHNTANLNGAGAGDAILYIEDVINKIDEANSIAVKNEKKGQTIIIDTVSVTGDDKDDVAKLRGTADDIYKDIKDHEQKPLEEIVEVIKEKDDVTDKNLTDLLKDEKLAEDTKDVNDILKEYNEEINKETNERIEKEIKKYINEGLIPPIPLGGIKEWYSSRTGELLERYYVDSDGKTVWSDYYTAGKIRMHIDYDEDPDGNKIRTVTRYYLDVAPNGEDEIPSEQIEFINKEIQDYSTTSNYRILECVEYHRNGNLKRVGNFYPGHTNSERIYAENGILASDHSVTPEGVHYVITRYTQIDSRAPLVPCIGEISTSQIYTVEKGQYSNIYHYTRNYRKTPIQQNDSEGVYRYGWQIEESVSHYIAYEWLYERS